jgi:ribosomal protein S18 acetylase RimI-like enzyme
MEYTIRKAVENDKEQIAQTIAYSFKEDFIGKTKDMDVIASILVKNAYIFENGVNTDRFIVAEQNGKIIGVIVCADCTVRAVVPTKKDCRKKLGFIRGSISYMVFREEFVNPLELPPTTGAIDIVGVLEEARGQGIAKAMLEKTVEDNPQYSEFVLNVKDNNAPAIKAYEKFGFSEYERVPYKWAKQAGFSAKVWMKYTKCTLSHSSNSGM